MHAPDPTSLTWRKSTYSNAQGECVEIATCGTGVAIRDSKNPDRGTLVVDAGAWNRFIDEVRNREFNRPW